MYDMFFVLPTKLLNHGADGNSVTAAGQDAENNDSVVVEANNTKDLRSRGLCLVPASSTSHLAADDFWAAAAAPPPLGSGIIWR
jgi:hypothetical protein